MTNLLKTKSLKEVGDKILMFLVSIQLLYILITFLMSSSDAIIISLPFYSPIGLIISYGVLCLFIYALSHTYSILTFLTTAYIVLMSLRLGINLAIGESYQSDFINISVTPWSIQDSILLGLVSVLGFMLPKVNQRYNLTYRGQLYYRFLKFKQYQILQRPILKSAKN